MKEKKQINNFLKMKNAIYFIYEEEYWSASGPQICRNISLFSSLESKQGILAYKITRKEYEEQEAIANKLPNTTVSGIAFKSRLEAFAMGMMGLFIYGMYFILGEETMEFEVSYNTYIIMTYLSMVLVFATIIFIYRYILKKKEMQLKESTAVSKRFNFDLPVHFRSFLNGLVYGTAIIPAIVYMVSGKETDTLAIGILMGGALSILMFMPIHYPWKFVAYNEILIWNPNKEFCKSCSIKKKLMPIWGFVAILIITVAIFLMF